MHTRTRHDNYYHLLHYYSYTHTPTHTHLHTHKQTCRRVHPCFRKHTHTHYTQQHHCTSTHTSHTLLCTTTTHYTTTTTTHTHTPDAGSTPVSQAPPCGDRSRAHGRQPAKPSSQPAAAQPHTHKHTHTPNSLSLPPSKQLTLCLHSLLSYITKLIVASIHPQVGYSVLTSEASTSQQTLC
jgi:hypothetical protein